MDGHRFYTYGTLFSNINLGQGTHPFFSGGLSPWGATAASFTTFWNISSRNRDVPIAPPGYDMGEDRWGIQSMPCGESCMALLTSGEQVNAPPLVTKEYG